MDESRESRLHGSQKRIKAGMSAQDVRLHAGLVGQPGDDWWDWFTEKARSILNEEASDLTTWRKMQPDVKEKCRRRLRESYPTVWEASLEEEVCEWRLEASQYQRRRQVGGAPNTATIHSDAELTTPSSTQETAAPAPPVAETARRRYDPVRDIN
ncbi:hypothetical protein LTR56_024288 [Elasticomyces elasticus]|nr:hypothetical protein LTR22_028103 [Elasticomyces elasticus]KAK3619033.1 hypothetical protein LTR56_024288 [Elasticomyces elasticus]KAK4905895.1 hypothetical protein LTR49_024865 [Elasticomyces elasticus]